MSEPRHGSEDNGALTTVAAGFVVDEFAIDKVTHLIVVAVHFRAKFGFSAGVVPAECVGCAVGRTLGLGHAADLNPPNGDKRKGTPIIDLNQ